MNEQHLVHPDIVPGAGLTPARETHWLEPGRAGVAGFEVAIVRGKRDQKPVARGSARYPRLFAAEATGDVDLAQGLPTGLPFSSAEQQEQQLALLSVKTGIEVWPSSFSKRSSVMASKSLRSMALSLRLRSRNRSKIRIVSSVDGGPTMQTKISPIFVADQTLRRTMLQFVPRQRAPTGSG
ncbi:hypothetical protein [Bradyrhizobium sp. McL0615]|uniref:hypothetical protein n=1 Tax=Bradyrhizobium sp. McL0615 TaxID=3415673 RepID=UPI003CE705E3